MTAAVSSTGASPFDTLAADYDRSFTHSRIGAQMRQAVLSRLKVCFQPDDHILELNCGTGEDALYLAQNGVQVLATDASAAMAQQAQLKVEQAGFAERVTVRPLAIEEIVGLAQSPQAASALPGLPFDGALSNFGGLNCVEDLAAVGVGLASCLRPGAIAIVNLMGPVCLWEWGWYLRKGQPGKAFRRLRRNGVAWHGLTIRYPSIRAARCAFAPHFRLRRVAAIGALLPPTYAEAWAERHPRLLAHLDAWERRLETRWPLPLLADHYLLEFERA
jgi:SAM-dependent methyltransferase